MKLTYTKLSKNSLALLCAMAFFASCHKIQTVPHEPSRGGEAVSFSATTEQNAATRTSLSVGTTGAEVHWNDADVVRVWTESGYADFTATVDATKRTTAEFAGKTPAEALLWATYPAASAMAADRILFPETIAYNADGVADGAMPMYAQMKNLDSPIAFKNLAGIVHIQLKGTQTIKTISITSTNILAGEATIDYNGGEPTTTFIEGGNTITLDCSGEPGGGVQLDAETATSFYITTPPTTAQSFTVTINTTHGEAMTRTSAENLSNQIRRSVIINMPEFTFTPAYEFDYTLNTDGSKTATITGLSSSSRAGNADLVIPSRVMHNGEEYVVSAIANNAFSNYEGLNNFSGGLVLAETIESIGAGAFHYCSALTGALIIPQSVKTIGSQAFQNCSGFSGSLTIPEGVETIEQTTFHGCNNLDGRLVIASTVKEIKTSALRNCNFTSITSRATTPPTMGNMVFDNTGSTQWKLRVEVPQTSVESYKSARGWDTFVENGGGFTAIVE